MISGALFDHGFRLLLTSLLGLALGIALVRHKDELTRGFAIMMIVWSLINLMFAIPALVSPGNPSLGGLREILAFNCGLNFAYIGVGLTLDRLAKPLVRGLGRGAVLNGLVLLVLDAYFLWRLPPVT